MCDFESQTINLEFKKNCLYFLLEYKALDLLNFPKMEELIVPLLIFAARILDVSIATIRIVLLNKGSEFWAPVLGFVETLIWVIAIGEIMKNLGSPVTYIAYAGGFAAGTYVGVLLEKKIAMGTSLIQVITKKEATNLVGVLRKLGIRTALVKATNSEGLINILYITTRRNNLANIFKIIKSHNPRAFVTVEELTVANDDEIHRRKHALRKIGKTK